MNAVKSTRFVPALVAIFALGLALRGAYLVEMARTPFFGVLVGDARAYDAWARQIAAGDWVGTETFYQAPLYPYFLGTVYAVVGRSVGVAKGLQALLGAAACVLLALAGRRFFSPRTGLLAGAILAVYPPAIFFDGMIQKSALDLIFVTTLLWLLSRVEDGGGPRDLVGAGVALGAFALTRENALVFLPVVGLWLPWRRWREGTGAALAAVSLFLAGVALVLLPVGIRNLAVGGEFLLTTAQSGINFYFGNHRGATGRHEPLRPGREMPEFERQDATEIAEAALGRTLTAREVSGYWRDQALAWIREHPLDWAAILARKGLLVVNRAEIADTESLETARDHSLVLRVLSSVLSFGLIAPLAAVGALATWRDRRRLVVLHLLALSFAAAVALFYVFARYRYPLVPFLTLFAAAGIVASIEGVGRGDGRALARSAAILVLAAVAVWWPVLPAADSRPVTYSNYGLGLAADGRAEEALALFRRAIALAPREPEIRYNLAVSLARTGRLAEARAAYEEVLRLDPRHAPARDNLGVLLAQEGRLDDAERLFREALALDPASASPRVNLGNVAYLRGDRAAAERWYREALAVAPGDPSATQALANLDGRP